MAEDAVDRCARGCWSASGKGCGAAADCCLGCAVCCGPVGCCCCDLLTSVWVCGSGLGYCWAADDGCCCCCCNCIGEGCWQPAAVPAGCAWP
jgi:hypothetical protein